MGKLNNLVDFYVEESIKEGRTLEQKELFKNALTKDVIAEVKAQITEAEKIAQKKELRKIENAERARLKRGRIATFIIDALALAFLVGFGVNQITNLLEQLRKGMGWSEVAFSVVLIIGSALIITWFLFAQMGIKLKSEENPDDE